MTKRERFYRGLRTILWSVPGKRLLGLLVLWMSSQTWMYGQNDAQSVILQPNTSLPGYIAEVLFRSDPLESVALDAESNVWRGVNTGDTVALFSWEPIPDSLTKYIPWRDTCTHRQVFHYLRFWELRLTHPVSFDFAIIQSPTNFSQDIMVDEISFYVATFQQRISFHDSHFLRPADFGGAHFQQVGHFERTQFDSAADFGSATFDFPTDFFAGYFGGGVSFQDATIGKSLRFHASPFHGPANFMRLNLASKASLSFTDLRFDKEISFDGANLSGESVNFWRCSFGGEVSFRNTILPQKLVFREVKEVANPIDLTLAKLPSSGKRCLIDLTGTDMNMVKIDYQKFKLFWPENTTYEDKNSIYERLLVAFETEGYRDSYQRLNIEYQDFIYQHKIETSASWFYATWFRMAHFIDYHWWEYGYRKEKIFQHALLFLLCFGFINWLFFGLLHKQVYEIGSVWPPEVSMGRKHYILWDYRLVGLWIPSVRSLYYSAFYTAYVFFGVKISLERINIRHKPGAVYLFVQYILGLICLAYLANFVITG